MNKKIMVVIGLIALLAGMVMAAGCEKKAADKPAADKPAAHKPAKLSADDKKPAVIMDDPRMQKAVFAGGHFWCMTPPFEKINGVKQVVAGYAGCHQPNPTYEQVAAGGSGCLEAVMVIFDPRKVPYKDLLEVFWRQIDPTDDGGQFSDQGSQYRTAIYYFGYKQKMEAEASKAELSDSGRFDQPIVTMILPFLRFYPAEQYHQDYYQKNPQDYEQYRKASGRDQFLQKAWPPEKPAESEGGEETPE
ncbi:MAG TPA: peptide-methionine (S)-S-oxide reductase MsrA [bacterium]|nr:peptide-methionine (S)-S-oxide reductase MsrA [bacterium]